MKATIPTEHAEQVTFVQWFRRTYQDVLIFAIPNGGHRNAVVASKLKAEGVMRGVPDLLIPAWGVWVEMKRAKGGRLSWEQKHMIEYLEANGYAVIVANGAANAIEQVREWHDTHNPA